MPKTQKHPGGRPTKYTKELADTICERLAMGESMRTIAKDKESRTRENELPTVGEIWLLKSKNEP